MSPKESSSLRSSARCAVSAHLGTLEPVGGVHAPAREQVRHGLGVWRFLHHDL
jgi:hypothetical protein